MQKALLIQWGFKPRLNEVKPPADASDFLKVIYRASSIKIRAQIRRANLINRQVHFPGSRMENELVFFVRSEFISRKRMIV